MRELTTLSDRERAERLAGWLVTQGIPSQVDPEHDQWIIWVVNDDDREPAQQILEEFLQDPDNPRYGAARAEAKRIARKEDEARKKIRRRQVRRSTWCRSAT